MPLWVAICSLTLLHPADIISPLNSKTTGATTVARAIVIKEKVKCPHIQSANIPRAAATCAWAGTPDLSPAAAVSRRLVG